MDYIKIITPENIELEYRLAGIGSRLAACVIDSLIQIAAIIVTLVIAMGFIWDDLFSGSIFRESTGSRFGWLIAVLLILFFAIYYLYYVISELVMNGQSIGKRVYGLRVIRDNGQPISLSSSLIRNLFRYIIDIAGVGILVIIFSKKQKRLGDMLAGTIVVDEGSKADIEKVQLSSILSENNERPNNTYPLSDEEYYILKQYLARKDSFIDEGKAIHVRLTQLLYYKFAISESEVDYTFLCKLAEMNVR